MKGKTPLLSKSNVVYKFSCPGCDQSYIGKTNRTLKERTIEHAWDDNNSVVKQHINTCEGFNFIKSLHNLNIDDELPVNCRDFNINTIQDHTKVIAQADNWVVLLFKEALMIKSNNPSLNSGLAASRDLQLF